MNLLTQGPKTISGIWKKYPFYTIGGLLLILLLVDYFVILQFQLGVLMSLNPKIAKLLPQHGAKE